LNDYAIVRRLELNVKRTSPGYNPPAVAPDLLRIRAGDWNRVTAHLQSCLPEEGCGLLAGRGPDVELIVPIENAEHSSSHYHMEHRALIEAFHRVDQLGLELLGAFHSHPHGPAGVSQSDVEEWQYPEAALVVCTRLGDEWTARGFMAEAGGVREIPLLVDLG
jgi:proteasome lid subunit RPN8/RPN11